MRGKASRLVKGTEVVPDNLWIGVTNMRKLRGGNTENDLSTGEFLLVDKGFHSLGVGASQWLGNSTFNNGGKTTMTGEQERRLETEGFRTKTETAVENGKRKRRTEAATKTATKARVTGLRTMSNLNRLTGGPLMARKRRTMTG